MPDFTLDDIRQALAGPSFARTPPSPLTTALAGVPTVNDPDTLARMGAIPGMYSPDRLGQVKQAGILPTDDGLHSLVTGYNPESDPSANQFAQAAQIGMMTADPLYHGSPEMNLETLEPSTRGPLGPGVYSSPAEGIAKHYAGETGRIYQLPSKPRDIYIGGGHRTDEQWFGFKDDTKRLIAATEPDKKEAVKAIVEKMWSGDGYPLYQRLRHLYGGDDGVQRLFKRAGFEGIAAHVDGPETLLFDKQPLHSPPPTKQNPVAILGVRG